MGSYEQWGDKAADFEAENNRFASTTSKKQYKTNTPYHTGRKKSGGFFNTIFKMALIVFIIWLITAITK